MTEKLEDMSTDELKQELERLERNELEQKVLAKREAQKQLELEQQKEAEQKLRESIKAELLENASVPQSKASATVEDAAAKPEWMQFKEDFSQKNGYTGMSYEKLCQKVFQEQA